MKVIRMRFNSDRFPKWFLHLSARKRVFLIQYAINELFGNGDEGFKRALEVLDEGKDGKRKKEKSDEGLLEW